MTDVYPFCVARSTVSRVSVKVPIWFTLMVLSLQLPYLCLVGVVACSLRKGHLRQVELYFLTLRDF